ncbi:gluconokinase [Rhizobium sp. C4]|uniref:gluconokinase n=1 Tax=Rhizobium sp. C4 TaxID=1349800 RepID=UPI001E2A6E6F|nr:gluconokinase [Rhizobium sp. C4]MCD2173410.1 gluconokinase [Rhizobium sp. C4]
MAGLRIVVMGVSGCGKSSLGEALAHRLGLPFIEGDALHPAENVAKMASGAPLTDEDRWPWLARVGEALAAPDGGAVVSCSSLKRVYRDVLRREAGEGVIFVHLHGSRELLLSRMQRRPGHFMPASLLDSQLATLETPGPDENAIPVDCAEPLHPALERVADLISARQPR